MTDEPKLLVLAAPENTLLGGSKVWQRIDPAVLRDNLQEFIDNLNPATTALTSEANGFRLKSFDVQLTIGAKGEVGFLGTGVEASGSASLKLTFERKA